MLVTVNTRFVNTRFVNTRSANTRSVNTSIRVRDYLDISLVPGDAAIEGIGGSIAQR